MNEHKYRLEFIVKAKDWQAVVDIFKEELDIDSGKQDASDRKIDGVFVVQVWISKNKLNSDFYNKINDSSKIALSYDPSGKKIRDTILERVCIVEHDLRKLLLNISDVVDGYFKIYDKTNVAKIYKSERDIVRKGDINPITSHLTLEDEINIFSIELSPWRGRPLLADELLDLLSKADDLNRAIDALRSKTESHTVWDDVDRHILKSGKKWAEVLPALNELKDIRNKAAHFRIVTQSDLSRAMSLSLELKDTLAPKRESTEQDLRELHRSMNERMQSLPGIGAQLLETMKKISELQQVQMRPIAESAVAAQKAILESMQLNTGLLDSIKVSEAITKTFFDRSNLTTVNSVQTSAFASLSKINIPSVEVSQSAIDSILRAQRSLTGLNSSSQIDEGKEIDSGFVGDSESSGDDRLPQDHLSIDATKEKEE